ncbi:MAG: RNA polymerase sigma factor [Imperialibacter sp.]|uniref:RNA polymerase sigma factor n=1 Tax=Imperialibacter sp. TaxID=2038411 RepID=UPI0032EBA62E
MDNKSKQQVFKEAYQPCSKPFLRYCSALAYGKMEADDLVQDVLLTAYERFESIRQKDHLLHYLIRAARNRAISVWRRSKFKADWVEHHITQMSAGDVSQDTLVDIQFLYGALDELPWKQREAIILFEINGFHIKEIAALQNTSEGAIKSALVRGRAKLRQSLESPEKKRKIFIWLFSTGSAGHMPSLGLDELFKKLAQSDMGVSAGHLERVFAKAMTHHGAISGAFSIAKAGSFAKSALSIALVGSLVCMKPAVDKDPEISSDASSIERASVPNFNLSCKSMSQPGMTIKPLMLGGFQVQVVELPEVKGPDERPTFSFAPVAKAQSPIRLASHVVASATIGQQIIFPAKNENSPDTNSTNTWGTNCDTEITILPEQLKVFKRKLLDRLRSDKLSNRKNGKTTIIFKEGGLMLNGQLIPDDLEKGYYRLLGDFEITPCPIRLIEITDDYVAVGDIMPDGFHGTLMGKIDLMDLPKSLN